MSGKAKTTAMTSDRKPALTPKLRFPEFRDAGGWEETQLRTIARPVSDRAVTGDGDDVLSLSGEHGLVLQSDYFGKKVAGDSAERYLKLVRNDFVYNDRTTKASVYGTIKRLSKYNGGIVSPIYKCFRFEGGETPEFWEWYFEASAHESQLGGLVNEGARAGRFNISISQFLSTSVWRPEESEQQKIADCLTSVDELIAAQARKVDALKTHRKWLMQQLFPREGETQPRIRFPEFEDAGEWGKKKLDELVDIQSGATPSKGNPEFWNGSIPWVSAKDMKRLFLEDTEDHISAAALDDGARLVPPGTLLVLTRGMTLLKDVPICVLRREMSFNQDVKGLRPKDGVDGLFLAWMLTGSKDRLLAMVDIAGHGTGKLDTDELKALELILPLPPEQQRIAECLTSLDDLIAAQTQKLDALKTHKKGLMQQLFPSPGEVEA
jgi:type I restriction enzyme S subunit